MKQRPILGVFLFLLCFPHLYAQENVHAEQNYLAAGSLSLRTNMITWIALTPGLGVEYKPTGHISILVDGAFARWDWDKDTRHHRLWTINPQLRYYTGPLKDSYMGLDARLGQYNFNWSGGSLKGHQGDFVGGGITFGHQFYLLLVDLGLSLGYLYLYNKEEYIHMDGQDYRSAKGSKGYWGPTGASMNFVWKIN